MPLQEDQHFVQAIKLYGGAVSSQLETGLSCGTAVLVVQHLQMQDLGNFPAGVNQLTTQSHVLVSVLGLAIWHACLTPVSAFWEFL